MAEPTEQGFLDTDSDAIRFLNLTSQGTHSEASGRCIAVFSQTDPQFKHLMMKTISWLLRGDYDEDEQQLISLGFQIVLRQYFEEANAIRKGLSVGVKGEKLLTIRRFAETLNKQPPSAAALAILAFWPTEEEVREAIANIARQGAKAKHADHTEPKKAEVREWWLKWRTDPNLYKNKTSFDEAMSDKTGMKIRTVERWRIEMQKENTPC